MVLGLRTVVYHVNDIAKAKEWYSKAFGLEPYFDQPFYVGFNVGGYELGLDPDMTGIANGNNSVAYWGVANIEAALKHFLTVGGIKNADIQEVGEGIKVASVRDPFGNVIGLIENPHFKLA